MSELVLHEEWRSADDEVRKKLPLAEASILFLVAFLVGAGVVMPDFFHRVFLAGRGPDDFERFGNGSKNVVVVVCSSDILNQNLLVGVSFRDGLKD